MNSVTVEELVMRIEIELDRFRSQSVEAERLEKRLRSSLKETKQSADSASESFDALGESVGESNKELTSKAKTIVDVTKRLVGFFAVITGSNAVHRFVSGISNANDQLNFLSQRLGMSARDIKGIDTAIAALGGANASAINSIVSLNQGIQEMVLMGNDALIPFFSAMGVSVVDASGAVREMDDILLDMSDSLSRMDPRQAYALANAMGLDEGVTNALMQGREAMQDMLDLHKQIYVSTQAELDASRELSKAQAVLSAQWQGLKTIIANMLTPALLHITKVVSGWVDYLNRNERVVKAFFVGISTAIGVVLLPMLTKAAIAMIAFMSPFLLASLAVAALGTAIGLLYEDYKVWAAGGKSLFDWESFTEAISGTAEFVGKLKEAFKELTSFVVTVFAPVFEKIGEAFEKIKNGDISGGFKSIGESLIRGTKIAVGELDEAIAQTFEHHGWQWGADATRRGAQNRQTWMNIVGSKLSSDDYVEVNGLPVPIDRVPGMRELKSMGRDDDLHSMLDQADKNAGLPAGTMRSIFQQETGGSREYIDNPEKYHYKKNAEGKRIAPHTGKVSTAFGPFGIVESTAKDPGFGVTPLQNKTLEEQIRFASEYAAARIRHAGSLEKGLAGYGEGIGYARSVIGRIGANNPVTQMTQPSVAVNNRSIAGGARNVSVSVGNVTVNTTANTLPSATAEGVAAGIERSSGLLDQLGGGI